MIRFDVSALTKAPLGTSLTLNVDVGPQSLIDLELDFLRGTIQVVRVQGGLLVQGTVESRLVRPDGLYAVGDDGWLDLAPLLREQAWVAIPMKPLCRADCKGLCPQCGATLNLESCTCEAEKVDPRLAFLKDLL
jgi:uncharacterized protein